MRSASCCSSTVSPSANATAAGRRWVLLPHEREGHRRGVEAVPVVRPEPSRNVVVPFESVVAVPVVRPEPSRNVRVPFESVVTVPVVRPLASRNVVDCADAAVTMTNISPIMQNVFIASLRC
jgi:hypothetical protein